MFTLVGVPLFWIGLRPILHGISAWLVVATIIPLRAVISKTTKLVHEAVHGALFKTPLLNQFADRVEGWWAVFDFVAFDALHRKRHAHVCSLSCIEPMYIAGNSCFLVFQSESSEKPGMFVKRF